MVVFTCAHCGEPVKKPMVSKHYERKCYGRNPDLCCVDCLKDFRGNEYEAHTKCISENERYGAKGTVQANSVNKGEQKQQFWSECIQNILNSSTLRDDERRLIGLLSKHENVPRKKAKFQNFLNSAYKSSRFSNELVDRVWVQIEKVFKETKEGAGSNKQGNVETNGKAVEEKNDSTESKKRKHEGKEEENTQEAETVAADEPEVKKSKKSKKNKVKAAEIAEEDNQVKDNINDDDETPSENKSDKKKKKKRKNKDSEPVEETKQEIEPEPEPLTNGESKKKKKKEKKEETNEKQETINDKENLKESDKNDVEFLWVDNIKSILSKKNADEEILIKKIEKKVLKRFSKATGAEATPKESKKFMKRLKKMKDLTLKGDYLIIHKNEG